MIRDDGDNDDGNDNDDDNDDDDHDNDDDDDDSEFRVQNLLSLKAYTLKTKLIASG